MSVLMRGIVETETELFILNLSFIVSVFMLKVRSFVINFKQ